MTEQYEVVHCKTKEEWNTVESIIGYKFGMVYTQDDCINFKHNLRANLLYYQNQESKIYSFEEFIALQSSTPNSKDDLSYLTEFLIKNEIT